jgi:hypothetical protein
MILVIGLDTNFLDPRFSGEENHTVNNEPGIEGISLIRFACIFPCINCISLFS